MNVTDTSFPFDPLANCADPSTFLWTRPERRGFRDVGDCPRKFIPDAVTWRPIPPGG